MGYRDDLYNIGNIIGYTGSLHDFPTVYFRCDRLGLAGHITQKHDRPQNVGRHEPFETIGYSIRNKYDAEKGKLVAKEYFYAYAFHTSRGAYTEIGTAVRPGRGEFIDMHAINILATAIARNTDQKQMSTIGDRQEVQLDQVKYQKGLAMSQMLQVIALREQGDEARRRRGLV